MTGGGAGTKERHFSYYAYSGGDGALRWKHDSKDFRRDASSLSEQLLPQHNYKLDASALSARHFGEAECREFREAVLDVMPHRWVSRRCLDMPFWIYFQEDFSEMLLEYEQEAVLDAMPRDGRTRCKCNLSLSC